jgi:hypothetical protein
MDRTFIRPLEGIQELGRGMDVGPVAFAPDLDRVVLDLPQQGVAVLARENFIRVLKWPRKIGPTPKV